MAKSSLLQKQTSYLPGEKFKEIYLKDQLGSTIKDIINETSIIFWKKDPLLTNAVQMQPQPLPKFFKVALNIDSKGGIIIS